VLQAIDNSLQKTPGTLKASLQEYAPESVPDRCEAVFRFPMPSSHEPKARRTRTAEFFAPRCEPPMVLVQNAPITGEHGPDVSGCNAAFPPMVSIDRFRQITKWLAPSIMRIKNSQSSLARSVSSNIPISSKSARRKKNPIVIKSIARIARNGSPSGGLKRATETLLPVIL
jgi:hypothetical protein